VEHREFSGRFIDLPARRPGRSPCLRGLTRVDSPSSSKAGPAALLQSAGFGL
jgi:hypothetical protein